MVKMKKASNVLVFLVITWCSAIVAAPLLAIAGGVFLEISAVLYKFFGVVCHQIDSRSFHIGEHPFGVCIRCSAIYFGFLFGIMLLRLNKKLSPQKFSTRIFLTVISLPMFIDVVLAFTPWYESSTITRLITGGVFGFGISLALYHSLIETIYLLMHSKIFTYESKT